MATLEQVEKLKARANVSFEEAKEALEKSGDDLLDALIYLERKGKVPPPQDGGFYTSKREEPPKQAPHVHRQQNGETFRQLLRRFAAWAARMIKKGNENMFEIWRAGECRLPMPVTVMALLLIVGFWVTVPLLVVGLFFGFSYRFTGPNVEGTGVNSVMDSVSKAADSIKAEVMEHKNDQGDRPK